MIGPSLIWVLCGQALAFINDNRYISLQRRELKSRGLVAEELSHRVTKAKLVIFSPSSEDDALNDRERGFAITFRTPALDDTGVTHILEHSVFEGSKKYPVMNSIGHFDRSSMATFVNAMTAPESTMYPVATVDKTDLLNLASVYMDGVFDPLILTNRTGFDREGWHYQYDESTSKLSYGGVVYNEMKGVYSNPKSLISRTIRRVLYENSTLGLESGGHPEKIPTLSYDYAIKYYMLHYHPANAYFFYYGPQSDFQTHYSIGQGTSSASIASSENGGDSSPVGKKILDMIDWYTTMAQARFQRKYNNLGQWTQNITSIVLPQLPNNTETSSLSERSSSEGSSSRSVIVREISQKVPSSNNKTTIRIDSLIDLSENFTPCELQAINVLNTLFCSSKESPLYQRFEREQIGETISGASISTGYPAIQFALQIDGVDSALLSTDSISITDRMLGIISDEVSKAQFSPARVYSVIKRMEIGLKAEMTTQSGRAMNLFDEIVDPWLYVGEPLQLLERVENLNCVKELYMNNTDYFEDLLKRRLHLVEPRGRYGRKIVVMKAEGDPSASTRLEELEQAKLDRLKKTFSSEELLQISKYAIKLESAVNAGDSPEDVATLPTLSPKNIVREVDPDHYSVTTLGTNPDSNAVISAEEVRGATFRTLKARPVTEKFTEWMLQSAGAPTFRSLESANVNFDVVKPSLTLSSDMWLKAAQLMMNQQLQQQPATSLRNMPAHLQLVEAVIPRGRPLTLNEAASGAITRETQQMRRIPSSLETKFSESVTTARILQNDIRGRTAAATPLFFYHGTTGGLVFITLHFDLNDLNLEELSQIAILDHLLNHGYVADLEPAILRETLDTFTGGGLTLDWHIKDARSTDDLKEKAKNLVSDNSVGSVVGTLSFRCLMTDLELCMGFVERFVLAPNLAANTQNALIVKNWLKREINNREQSGLKNPNGLASTRVRSKYNIRTRLAEMLEGTDAAELFYKPWLRSLSSTDNSTQVWQTQIGDGLERLLQKMLIQENIAIQLTAERESLSVIRERLLRFMNRLPRNRKLKDSCWHLKGGRVDRPAMWRNEVTQGSIGYSAEDEADKIDVPKIATDDLTSANNETADSPWAPLTRDLEVIEYDLRVNFNYWLLKLQSPGDDTKIPYSLFARVLTNKFLTPRVRMVGGAYGVWSTYSYHDGYIVFGSYRDPHRARTYNEYALAAKAFSLEQSDLDGFVIRFIADMDKPISILEQSNREFNRWAEGLTPAQRQKYRDEVLNAGIDQGAVFQQALWEAMQCEEAGDAGDANNIYDDYLDSSEASSTESETSVAVARTGTNSTMICTGGIKVSVGGRKRT